MTTTRLQINQPVMTPNGKAIFQFYMHSDGERYPMVSYPGDATIDKDKCKSVAHAPGGMWWLCGYEPGQVVAL